MKKKPQKDNFQQWARKALRTISSQIVTVNENVGKLMKHHNVHHHIDLSKEDKIIKDAMSRIPTEQVNQPERKNKDARK